MPLGSGRMKWKDKKIMSREEVGKLIAELGRNILESGSFLSKTYCFGNEYTEKHGKRKSEIELE